ncbi:tetracycline resistance protein [Mycena rosella]|uniref:Tetracycline resistance protein n=1 Tax=Mycena rosella TaxID=1033263 RepID=A0AAD7CSB1_MYCRO|nr:tetracycline resistance protein [Mycena rosella]
MSFQRSIAIVGAGLGGLACARVLQLQNIPVIIYEREPTPESRQQGGSLDMHSDSGFKALQMAELVDEFKKLARYEDQQMKIVGMDGTVHFANIEQPPEEGSEIDRPEIDRTQLRGILLDSLKPGTVKWNHGISKVTQEDNKATLHFLDSALESAAHDFVVGADGAWSRVRPTLSSTVPVYSGVTFVDIFLNNVEKNHPDLAAFVKGGSTMVLGDNKGIMPQRNSNDVVRVYVAFRKPLAWVDEVGLKALVEEGRQAEARALLLKEFEGWCSQARGYLQVPCFSMDVRPLYTFKRHAWDANPHVTLLGDAAHCLVPFAGEGANLAMLDGTELATVIAKNMSAKGDAWLRAIKGFEAKMQRRAWSASDEGVSNMDTFISDNDPAARSGAMMWRMMMVMNAWLTVKRFAFGWTRWLR